MLGCYTRRYARGDSPGKEYTDALTARLRSLQREYGFEPTTPRAERMREQRMVAKSGDMQESLL
jgi:hypothetical protein